ncbi:hypothetical protein GA830_00750 [Mesorhizobium sp. NBSH29]|uniref:aminotransferase class IV family protein n=1 Tax=Mesorhizobium sp. NBSH29 TaxID=2654249 RepID=UPI00189693A2|nr:aminotransferase class IV family protein [Mesorhizobium sp. NBSH29]QPC85434.1 hypothetical protein GA830_00750 [Mesorhizobium sp. NBSH29]
MSSQGPLRDGDGSGPFGLIETLRYEPDGGFQRLDRHLARLELSARELGIPCNLQQVQQALEAATLHATSALRMRLFLSRDGLAEITAQPFAPVAPETIWTLRIATRAQLDSADPLLRHKTSRRDAYAAARAEFTGEEADEVLLLNEHGDLCEGTITTLFADMGDGILATPPLSCGLLAGILRAELLASGQAREAVLTPDTLASAKTLHVGNALRGLIPARMA